MVPASFRDFFVASAGAGAALVGLLFVAVSIAPERTVMRDAPVERQAIASSTFTALVNAFFISLVALVPGAGLGFIAAIMGALALVNSFTLGWHLLRRRHDWMGTLRRAFLVLVGLAIYGYELFYGIQLIAHPKDVGLVYVLASLLVAVYGVGLTRAWELLGAQRYSLLGRLSLLREVEAAPTSAAGRRALDAVQPESAGGSEARQAGLTARSSDHATQD
jgi:hypothetical protein